MGRRPRLLVLGLLVLAAVLWGSQTASSSQPVAPTSQVVRGGVVSGGQASTDARWQVEQLGTGRYRIAVDADVVDLDVPEWDAAGDVVIMPLGAGRTEVRFSTGRAPVDSDFDFVATLTEA